MKITKVLFSILSFLILLVSATSQAVEEGVASDNTAIKLSLIGEKNGTNEYGDPCSTIKLSIRGVIEKDEVIDNKVTGECWNMTKEGNWPKPKNALVAVMCWYAGAGDEFSVYRIKNKLIIKKRWVDSQVGTGNFEILKTILIPESVKNINVQ